MTAPVVCVDVQESGTAPAPEARPSDRQLSLSLGFSHWFGPRLGTPEGLDTPTVSLGVRPALRFVELRLRYAGSTRALDLPTGVRSHVGFVSVEATVTHGLAVGAQRIDLYAGPLATLVHSNGATAGMGILIGTRLLIRAGKAGIAIGPFFEARSVFYKLPGERGGLLDPGRRDAQIDLGVVATAF